MIHVELNTSKMQITHYHAYFETYTNCYLKIYITFGFLISLVAQANVHICMLSVVIEIKKYYNIDRKNVCINIQVLCDIT